MKCLELSNKNGWKPQILCDMLEINTYELKKIMAQIDPQKKHFVYSTFDIIMLASLINFLEKGHSDLTKILQINWLKFKDEVIEKVKVDDYLKMIQINWLTKEVIFTDYENHDKKEKEGYSYSFDLKEIICEVQSCFLWKNL